MEISHYKTLRQVENFHWWFVTKRSLVAKLIPKEARSVLDVGAGTGAFVEYLLSLGYDASGIEQSDLGLKYAHKSRLPVKHGNSNHILERDNQFDCVTCIDVLYHKKVNTDKSLREMLRVLKPGGTLIVFDCAFNWLKGPHDLEVHARERFTSKYLKNLISKAGGKIRYSTYCYFLLFPIIALARIFEKFTGAHNRITTPLPLFNLIIKMIMKIEISTIPNISYPWGSSIIVVATK